MKHLILSIALFFSTMGVMAQAEFEEGCQFYNQKQYSKAVAIFQKYADEGVAQGQFNLAICYEKGNGVPKDYAKAAYWYEKAANQGDATAQSIIGDFYYDGTGVTQNYQKAVYWYEKAANQGDASAQTNMGNCYSEGTVVALKLRKECNLLEMSIG